MDLQNIYSFLFESYVGVGVLVGGGIVISIIVSIILEFRTKKMYKEHVQQPDEWAISDETDECANQQSSQETEEK